MQKLESKLEANIYKRIQENAAYELPIGQRWILP